MLHNLRNISTTDIRCAGSLTVDAITGITDISESLHQTITSVAGILGDPYKSRTKGITSMVYNNIRTVTKLVGGGIDALFERLSPILVENESAFDKKEISPNREAFISALNGVIGDYLASKNNPLAISSMQFRSNGKPLSSEQLLEAIQQSNGKVALMLHGLCMNDLQWNRQGHDHGEALARDLGYLPLYIHYNTGLHISENGKKLSDLLQTAINQLFEQQNQFQSLKPTQPQHKIESLNSTASIKSPQPIKLIIIAHSMGGLVSRSGCYYAKQSGHTWLNYLDKMIFLGTPHHGAPLAKGGSLIDNILEINPYSAPFSRLGKIRSCGLTDLRYGNVVADDWKGQDRFAFSRDTRTPVPLPEGVKCYSIAATTAKESENCCADIIGDGLVTLSSALGYHKKSEFNLLFPETHKWVGCNMNHIDILNHPEVYETIKSYVKA
ncbi:MAG: hypothetical protein HQK70_04545 [Desulfamplus sp.]|nr:hypothetical protein [Desulfamplus sp.]